MGGSAEFQIPVEAGLEVGSETEESRMCPATPLSTPGHPWLSLGARHG